MATRPPVQRMFVIRDRISEGMRRGSLANCSGLALEFEVDRKTIQRDVDCLRYDWNLPIEYDAVRHGFYYSGDVDDLPLFRPSAGELLALFVAEKALGPLRGTPFESKVRSGLKKLAAQMGGEVTLTWRELDEAFSFRQSGVAKPDAEVFEALAAAVKAKKEVVFAYRKLGSKAPESRRVRPYRIAHIDGQWYLFAHDVARDALRRFVLGRIRGVERTRTTFTVPKDFSLKEELRESFGVFSSDGGKHKVRLRFDAFAAQLVREREWHASQETRDLKDGGLELSMELSSLPEVERWILSWGGHVEVKAPKALKEAVARTVREMAAALG
jgi:predicted DNA-binding transcriptional regulator YafY